jgi:hypothetical protein
MVLTPQADWTDEQNAYHARLVEESGGQENYERFLQSDCERIWNGRHLNPTRRLLQIANDYHVNGLDVTWNESHTIAEITNQMTEAGVIRQGPHSYAVGGERIVGAPPTYLFPPRMAHDRPIGMLSTDGPIPTTPSEYDRNFPNNEGAYDISSTRWQGIRIENPYNATQGLHIGRGCLCVTRGCTNPACIIAYNNNDYMALQGHRALAAQAGTATEGQMGHQALPPWDTGPTPIQE